MPTDTLIMPKQSSHETAHPLTLDALHPGNYAVIEKLDGSSVKIRQRLLEMGLTRGTHLQVIRFAPLGDPIEVAVRGYRLSLRKEEASSVVVRKISEPL